MHTPSDRFSILLPTLAGLALVLLVVAAGARMLGFLPGEIGAFRDARTIDVIATASADDDIDAGRGSKSPAPVSATGRRRCPECGVIVSIREIAATPSTGGTAAQDPDAVTAPAGRFEYTVRLQGGAQRLIIAANPTRWQPGERVIVIDGAGPAQP
jgi:hypothetical protein